MAFDFFIAPLRCPICGIVSPEDTSTNMQTKIQASPMGAYLRVGDKLDLRKSGPGSGGYLTIKEPLPTEPIHILDIWECSACGQPFNWAEIVLQNDVIVSITAVKLDQETLKRAHFISWQLEYVYPSITGQALFERNQVRSDFVKLLHKQLPK